MFLILQLLLLLTLSVRTDGYYFSMIHECTCSSADLTDVEYTYSIYFNKELSVQFNNTVGKFIGFNDFGMLDAERRNNGPSVQFHRTILDEVCKPGLYIMYSHFLHKKVRPKIRIRSRQEASGDHPTVLMCSAYDFYPPAIVVYWQRDGKRVTSGVVTTEVMANGNWYYQIHSHLQDMPKSGEKISCVVEHISSKEPIIHDWDTIPESEKNKIAIGTSGLVMGIILPTAGFIFYKTKSSGRDQMPK